MTRHKNIKVVTFTFLHFSFIPCYLYAFSIWSYYSSRVIHPELAYNSTQINCRIPSYFRIAKRSQVIRRNLIPTLRNPNFVTLGIKLCLEFDCSKCGLPPNHLIFLNNHFLQNSATLAHCGRPAWTGSKMAGTTRCGWSWPRQTSYLSRRRWRI